MQKPPGRDKRPSPRLCPLFGDRLIIPVSVCSACFGQVGRLLAAYEWLYLVGLLFGAVVGFWQVIRRLWHLTTTKMMTLSIRRSRKACRRSFRGISSRSVACRSDTYRTHHSRMLRNIVVSVLLLDLDCSGMTAGRSDWVCLWAAFPT